MTRRGDVARDRWIELAVSAARRAPTDPKLLAPARDAAEYGMVWVNSCWERGDLGVARATARAANRAWVEWTAEVRARLGVDDVI